MVDIEKPSDCGSGRVGPKHMLLPCPGQTVAQGVIGKQPIDLMSDINWVAFAGQQTGFLVTYYLGNAAGRCADDGRACQQGFNQGQTEPFRAPTGWQNRY